MRAAYRLTGAIARSADLSHLPEDRCSRAFMTLPALVASHEVFEFEWDRTFWVPMFQFELPGLLVKQGPRRVRAELADEFRGWTLATWFAQPNTWLNDQRPVDVLDSNLRAVLVAARADRFIAAG